MPLIVGIVRIRIDSLAPNTQLTLKLASVIGREFDMHTLDAVIPEVGRRARAPPRLESTARFQNLKAPGFKI